MRNNTANRSIQCSVRQCKNHCGSENFCSLPSIWVGTHESDPTVCQCVDCESFEKQN